MFNRVYLKRYVYAIIYVKLTEKLLNNRRNHNIANPYYSKKVKS